MQLLKGEGGILFDNIVYTCEIRVNLEAHKCSINIEYGQVTSLIKKEKVT